MRGKSLHGTGFPLLHEVSYIRCVYMANTNLHANHNEVRETAKNALSFLLRIEICILSLSTFQSPIRTAWLKSSFFSPSSLPLLKSYTVDVQVKGVERVRYAQKTYA
jgi:hypothetical protein